MRQTQPHAEYYRTLGLKPGASQEDIKKAYRQLVKTWHPDRYTQDPQLQEQAEEKIKKINEAYEQLKSLETPEPIPESKGAKDWKIEALHYYNLGAAEAKRENYKLAVEYFSQALWLNPNYIEAYRYRGLVYSMLGYDRKANSDFRMVSELKRKWGNSYSTQGQPRTTSPPTRKTNDPWLCAATLRGHGDAVTGIAINPDGRTFISSSYDETIRLWQLSTGQQLRVFSPFAGRVYCVAFSADGKIMASGHDDRTIRLWNPYTGTSIRTMGGWLSGHNEAVLSLVFHPDRKRLASGSSDRTIRLWKLQNGQELRSIIGYSGAVVSLAVSSDGKTLVSGSLEKTLKIRQMGTGKLVRSIRRDYKILAVAFHPNNQTFVTGGSDEMIRIWETESGRELQMFKGHINQVSSVGWSGDGQTLVSGSWDGEIKLWEVATGQEICTLREHGDRIATVAFSPDSHSLVSASADKTIKIWWKNN